MSLINPKDGWINFDGTPIQGKTPPQVRLRSGVLTPDRQAAVSDIYSKFTTAKSLSLAGGGYFTADRKLPDGTIVRMVSINNVDHVHIWAADPAPEETTVDITFWCQPFDEDWLTDQYEEVFTIPRWYDIGGGEVEIDTPENFLVDLARNANYEPVDSANYPGNQTWFAPSTGPLAGTVVSWWGAPKRYATSERDVAVHAGATWGRTTWPLSETVRFTDTTEEDLAAMMVAPTGGIAGAIGGHMFDMRGETSLPPGMTSVGQAQIVSTRLWIDGGAIQTEWTILSACLQYRDGETYLRIITPTGSVTATVREKLISGDGGEWTNLGSFTLAPGTLGVGAPVTGYTGVNSYSWRSDYAHLSQPFHWDAAGDKAVTIAHYITGYVSNPYSGGEYPMEKYGTHVVVEMTVGGGGITVTAVAQTDESISLARDYVMLSPGVGAFAGASKQETAVSTSDYSAPIAADYRDGALVVLKTHVTSDGAFDTTTTATNVGYTHPSTGFSGEYEAARNVASSTVLTFESWASLNDTEISGTRDSRPYISAGTVDSTFDFDPMFGFTGYSSDASYTHSASGALGLWGLSAGDLRGSHILLHNTPISRVPNAFSVGIDAQSDFTLSQTIHREGYPETFSSSIDATVSDLGDAGKLCLVDLSLLSADTIDHILAPTMRNGVGSLHADYAPGTTVTRIGTYGPGPWPGLEDFTTPPTMNPGLGETAMCPFVVFGTSGAAEGTGTSRISINASRSPLRHPASYLSGSMEVVGGYGNTVLSGSALTPDGKTQYLGAVFAAMTPPTAKNSPVGKTIERWFHDGSPFTPIYPDQIDPGDPDATVPFPHRGGHAILLNPIFTGPLP